MTTTDPHIPSRDTLHAALLDLLTTGQHHDAATTATLRAVGATRGSLTEPHQCSRHNPVAHYAQDQDRLTALSCALGDTTRALLTEQPFPDATLLRAGLSTLAAIALAWLDTLPHPTDDYEDDDYEDDGYEEPQPF